MKKKIISLILILIATNGYTATEYIDYTSTAQFFKNCEHIGFDKKSGCYIYLSAILDTMSLYKKPCLRITDSDKDMYKKIMKLSFQYLRRHPSATVYTSATILAHATLKAYPCSLNEKSQLME